MKKYLGAVLMLGLISTYGFVSDHGTVRGTVRDKSGNPIENVKIYVVSMEYTSLNATVVTDKNGRFIEINLQPGYYQIKVQKDGYLPLVIEKRVGSQQSIEASFELEEGKYRVSEVRGEEDFKKGNEWYVQENYEEAAKSYVQAINKEPDESIYYNSLGIAYLNLEKIDEAIEVYRKMLEIQPNSYNAHKMIGELHSLKEEYRQALPYLIQAVDLSPDDPDAFYNLGLCLLNTGANSQSLDAFKHCIELKPDYPMAYYQTGMIYVNQHRKNEAIQNLEKFLVLAPDNPNADVAKKIIEYLKTTR